MTADAKYKNLLRYLKRKDCQHTMCKKWLDKPEKFHKWYNRQADGLKEPKMIRLSKEFVYSPDNFIILDEGEEELCKAMTNPVSIAHDPISDRYGFVDYKAEQFISFTSHKEAEDKRRTHASKRVSKYIEKVPSFKKRLDRYKEMKENHDEG